MTHTIETLRPYEIRGRVAITPGHGGLPRVVVTTPGGTGELYLHGAHVTQFQKTGGAPLLFMSQKSVFASGQPIRGGVPICYPWFGGREGAPSHGLARLVEWRLVETAEHADGSVSVRLALPNETGLASWASLSTAFIVTVSDTLTMELVTSNAAGGETTSLEHCLHTYFHVADVERIHLTGLRAAPFDDFAAGETGTRKVERDDVLRITKETNRVSPDNTATVEIHDEALARTIRVEKSGSRSTVVWNPWTTQRLPDDFDPAEYRRMVCVESGNVKQNAVSLAAGQHAALKVVLSSR
jgi:D-hexose-6-phosphate mutarotase